LLSRHGSTSAMQCNAMTYVCVIRALHHFVSLTYASVVLLIRLGTAYLPKHLSSLPDFCGVCVVQSLLFCVVFCGNVCHFSYDHFIVCPSSISGCWLSFWHLQTFLYVILLVNDLHQVGVGIISRFLHQQKGPVLYNWNI
jgi:hypothetical protein